MGEWQDRCQGGARACERDLVLAFQDGARDAFAEIYRRHHARVLGTCSRMLDNRQDVEEAVQETFLRAYQALGRFNGDFQTSAWLTRIATNVCLDLLRARSRHTPLVLVPRLTYQIPDPSANAEDLLTRSDPRVHEAIERIQPLHARALKLRVVDGLSHQEMAGRLSMSPGQVKALLHRARCSFKRAFERAGNCALIPLAGIRHVIQRGRESAAGHPLVAAVAPAGAMIAERAATGVVIAAIAWTASPSPTTGAPIGPPVAPAPSAPTTALSSDEGNVTGALRARVRPDATNGQADDPALPRAARALLERAERVAGARPAPPPTPDGDEGGDEQLDLPGAPSAADTEHLAERAEDKIERTLKRRGR